MSLSDGKGHATADVCSLSTAPRYWSDETSGEVFKGVSPLNSSQISFISALRVALSHMMVVVCWLQGEKNGSPCFTVVDMGLFGLSQQTRRNKSCYLLVG